MLNIMNSEISPVFIKLSTDLNRTGCTCFYLRFDRILNIYEVNEYGELKYYIETIDGQTIRLTEDDYNTLKNKIRVLG